VSLSEQLETLYYLKRDRSSGYEKPKEKKFNPSEDSIAWRMERLLA